MEKSMKWSSTNIIACDGACGDGFGGWATILFKDDEVVSVQSGNMAATTNNQMELTAFIAALKIIDEIQERCTIYCDSAYITNCLADKWYIGWQRNGWHNSKGERVKNQELWEELIALYSKLTSKLLVTVQKVKGHSTNKYNNLADEMAVKEKYEIKTKYINTNELKSN